MSGAKPDGPYDGVPEHKLGGIELCFQGICGYMSSRGYREAQM